MLDHRSLMECHVDALYTVDAAGQLVRVREHDGGPAPRIFVGRCADTVVHRFRFDVPEATRQELVAASAHESNGEPDDDPPTAARAELARLSAILARSVPITASSAGPAYAFPEHLPLLPPDVGAIVRVTDANISVLDPLLSAWVPDVEYSPPLLAVVVNDQAVAVCGSVRITTRAHEAGVETAPAHRGRGHAARVVAAWAREVRAMGSEPLYSTSWENTASQAVARKLGLVRFGSDLHLT
jgi:GNAT superfamily N-acetyltransferase